MFVSGHFLSSQPAMVTCRSSGPFPGSYITPTREAVIVLLALAGFSKYGWMGGGLNHTVYHLSNKPAVCLCHPSHHWSHPLSRPPVCPPPSPLCCWPAMALFWLGSLASLAAKSCLHTGHPCLQKLSLSRPKQTFQQHVVACCADNSFVFSVIVGVWGRSLLKELHTDGEHVWNRFKECFLSQTPL